MVDAIGSRPVTNGRPVAPVTRVEATSAVDAATAEETSMSSAGALTAAAADMAASPPVDSDRVAQIRRAVQNGTFPIYPGKIADWLIAAAAEWSSDDQA